jgi:hypothetical protein
MLVVRSPRKEGWAMTMQRSRCSFVALALVALALSGCATGGGNSQDMPPIPEGAKQATRTEANGDTVTEYRVNGALAMVRVVPKNGPVYYVTDSDGDGRLDRNSDGTRNVPVYFKLYGW